MKLFGMALRRSDKRGFLQRLARDVAGNTAAIMAAALLPLAGFTGAAVDTARLYVVKVRLQQACDAGALAGRKMMTGTSLDQNAKDQAKTFFDNNFKPGWFQTTNVSFQATDTADGQVQGAASATVPVTLMRIFGSGPTTLNVTCEARKEIGDVDVMFVLDTTGSMVCNTSEASCTQPEQSYSTPYGTRWYEQEKSDSKIKALRSAVLTFYDTLAAAADANSRIRYGFVPYTSTVNVGTLIPASYIADTATYPSRRVVADQMTGAVTTATITKVDSATCNGYATRSKPFPQYPATKTTVSWTAVTSGGGQPGTCTTSTQSVIPIWRYENVPVDVSQYKTGATVTNPTKVDGTTAVWDGCIMERTTTSSATFTQAGLPSDLDIDLVPSSDTTRWKPAWIDVVYDRPNIASDDTTSDYWPSSSTVFRSRNVSTLLQQGYYVCPKRAQRLAVMTRGDVSNYVNASDFKAIGGTYHDVGMVWGARFISPTGPFAADTDCRPNRNCGRHIIFMTDGAMSPNNCVYGFQGIERVEGRVMGTTPVGGCTTATNQAGTSGLPSALTDRHNARLQAICTQAKNKGIVIWVVAYAQTLTQDMKDCASSSSTAIYAPTDQKLQDAFKTIAGKIAELRISK
ncbi:pilus assembly protein TadG-related protein [Sphingomonas tabacisoli]|uniref:Pilus assembly protein TadG-related protein n=1 Tax=Sphingomonas tabacisoli TaxID=2249466 RepID=A0ABW4I6V3_9SPHN